MSAAKREEKVRRHLEEILNVTAGTDMLDCITRIIFAPDDVQVLVPRSNAAYHSRPVHSGVAIEPEAVLTGQLRLTLPIVFGNKERDATISSVTRGSTACDEILIRALRRANAMLHRDHLGLPVIETSPVTPHERRLIRLALFAPDLQRDVLLGNQPRRMTPSALLKIPPQMFWQDQVGTF